MTTCRICQNLADQEVCEICADPRRDRSLLCVVADPRDLIAIERTNEYRGLYHVLGGVISPMEGVMPEQLRIKELVQRLRGGEVADLILAHRPKVEGITTMLFLERFLRPLGARISRMQLKAR